MDIKKLLKKHRVNFNEEIVEANVSMEELIIEGYELLGETEEAVFESTIEELEENIDVMEAIANGAANNETEAVVESRIEAILEAKKEGKWDAVKRVALNILTKVKLFVAKAMNKIMGMEKKIVDQAEALSDAAAEYANSADAKEFTYKGYAFADAIVTIEGSAKIIKALLEVETSKPISLDAKVGNQEGMFKHVTELEKMMSEIKKKMSGDGFKKRVINGPKATSGIKKAFAAFKKTEIKFSKANSGAAAFKKLYNALDDMDVKGDNEEIKDLFDELIQDIKDEKGDVKDKKAKVRDLNQVAANVKILAMIVQTYQIEVLKCYGPAIAGMKKLEGKFANNGEKE